ncbi:Increased rDNA silencing protein [Lachnellula hyalina]|uniref:Increased rDNA silencing protein n=1 Tax=Lachnellula hyalina TaxID=1316788 RepID=A0A8H8TXG0_9HELO|nr:Increased rDNA silencing protein [Lachnellula hyalina]TVY25974.1 Increased rDNA silencing protein [Lachnellula hyalina]
MTADRRQGTQDQLGKDAIASQRQSAALRGASLAFGKPPVKPKPQINTYSGNNGALAAATKVGARTNTTSTNKASISRLEASADDHRLGYQSTGGSTASMLHNGYGDRNPSRPRLGGNGHLQLPGAEKGGRSPSLIAATLAASRSPSVSPNPTGQQQTQPPNLALLAAGFAKRSASPPPSVRSVNSSRGSSDHSLDLTPIPPTTSLINMFEETGSSPKSQPPIKRPMTSASTRDEISPNPQRFPLPRRARSPSPLASKSREPQVILSKPVLKQLPPTSQPSETFKPAPRVKKPPSVATKPIPIPIPPKPQPQPPAEQEDEDNSSDDSFVSASEYEYKPPFRATLNHSGNQKHLTSTSAGSMNSSVTVDSLANAIVASSLASSRAASPSKNTLYPPPIPPSRRSARNHHHLFHNSASREPSPAKPGTLRTTLRKTKSKEAIDEGEKRRTRKAHLMKKHPNKHHEGDRKRWRDQITERERKRYEAVWASNKGLHLSYIPGAENLVCSVVVRDIWSRSRLHRDVLEEVYALVDRTEMGMLDRESFVCGLWLIDQWLKGRKLPQRVSESVWRSLGMRGLKVRPK